MIKQVIKIAICDDADIFVKVVSKLVSNYTWKEDIAITEYTDILNMVDDINKQEEQLYDLIITDIRFTEKNKISAVELLKDIQMRYPDLKIIYMTMFKNYAAGVANSLPFGYLVKPVTKDELYKLLDRFVLIERSRVDTAPSFVCRFRGEIVRIPYGQIRYVRSDDKKLYFICRDNTEHVIRGRLDEVWKKDFEKIEYLARPNKSYVVNLTCIDQFRGKEVVLCDGTRISIRPGYKDDFLLKTMKFLYQDMQ